MMDGCVVKAELVLTPGFETGGDGGVVAYGSNPSIRHNKISFSLLFNSAAARDKTKSP